MHAAIVEAVEPLGVPFEMVFVDDGSRDRTVEVATAIARRRPARARASSSAATTARRPAMAAGIEQAHGRVLVTMDGDLQNDPRRHRALPRQDRRRQRHRRRLALQPPGQADLPQDPVADRQLADRQGHRRTDQGQRLLAQGLPRRADQGDSAVLRDAPLHPGDGLHRGPAHRRDQGAPSRAPVRRSRSTACRASTRSCST